MEGPARSLLDDVPEIEANSLAGEVGVGGREQSNEQVHHQHHANQKIQSDEDFALPPFLAHDLEGELAQHPGEESDERATRRRTRTASDCC